LKGNVKTSKKWAFLYYMGERVEGFLFWRAVMPKVEELYHVLVPSFELLHLGWLLTKLLQGRKGGASL